MAVVTRFDVKEVNEMQPLTDSGAFASGKYASIVAETTQGGLSLQKSGLAVTTAPGGP